MRDLHQQEDFQVNSSSLKKRQRGINPCHKAAGFWRNGAPRRHFYFPQGSNSVIIQAVFEVFKNKSLNKAVSS